MPTTCLLPFPFMPKAACSSASVRCGLGEHRRRNEEDRIHTHAPPTHPSTGTRTMPPKLRPYLPYTPPSPHTLVLPSTPPPHAAAASSSAAACPPHDEELSLSPCRRTVHWRPLGGPSLYKQWSFPTPVLQVLFAYFPLSSSSSTTHPPTPQRCMCVLKEPELLIVYPPEGDSYEVPLPCEVRTRGSGVGRQQITSTHPSTHSFIHPPTHPPIHSSIHPPT